MPSSPTVHILLATYQGQMHLGAQLESIAKQTHANWTLLISDDGSTDNTLAISQHFATVSRQRVTLLQGPRKGSTFNFFHLLKSIQNTSRNDLFAFCDQDDVWLPCKLAAALENYQQVDVLGRPYLYCGRPQVVNATLSPMYLPAIPKRPLVFANAIAQSIASGNTMLFNRDLLEILRLISPAHSVWHDWSAYQVVTGCGGHIFYDQKPYLLYRQHNRNVVGAGNNWSAHFKRLSNLLDGSYRLKCNLTELAMTEIERYLTPNARETLACFKLLRHAKSVAERMKYTRQAGLIRQNRFEQAALTTGLIFGLA
jgi:glycosyltransferase involved in cell wall biosynthesis